MTDFIVNTNGYVLIAIAVIFGAVFTLSICKLASWDLPVPEDEDEYAMWVIK